jgi:hypothetical protein
VIYRALTTFTLGFLLVVGLTAPVSPARALTCIPVDIHDALRDADYAFIGRPQAQVGPASQPTRQFLFDVELWVKGDLGTTVLVTGFEWSEVQVGRRTAMIVNRTDDGQLRDNPCVWTEPETLLAVAELYATPLSTNPPALLIGGSFGAGRVMALDSTGQLVGLAAGDGTVLSMAACPGGRRVVELVSDDAWGSPAWVAVRDTSTFQVVREVGGLGFRDVGFAGSRAVSCRDEEGSEVLLGLPGLGIDRVSERLEPLHAGSFATLAIGDAWAVVFETDEHVEGAALDLQLLELATGERTPLAPPTDRTDPIAFAFSPDDSLLALFGRTPYESRQGGMFVHLYAVPSGELLSTALIPAPRECSCSGDLTWMANGEVLIRAQHWTERGAQASSILVYSTPELELVSEWPGGEGDAAVVAGGVMLTIDRSAGYAQLVATSLNDGRRVALRPLATSIATSIVALPALDEQAAAALLEQVTPESPGPQSPMPGAPLVGQPTQPTAAMDPGLIVGLALVVLVVLLVGGVLARRRLSST